MPLQVKQFSTIKKRPFGLFFLQPLPPLRQPFQQQAYYKTYYSSYAGKYGRSHQVIAVDIGNQRKQGAGGCPCFCSRIKMLLHHYSPSIAV